MNTFSTRYQIVNSPKPKHQLALFYNANQLTLGLVKVFSGGRLSSARLAHFRLAQLSILSGARANPRSPHSAFLGPALLLCRDRPSIRARARDRAITRAAGPRQRSGCAASRARRPPPPRNAPTVGLAGARRHTTTVRSGSTCICGPTTDHDHAAPDGMSASKTSRIRRPGAIRAPPSH